MRGIWSLQGPRGSEAVNGFDESNRRDHTLVFNVIFLGANYTCKKPPFADNFWLGKMLTRGAHLGLKRKTRELSCLPN